MATFPTFLAQVRRELEEVTAGVWADESILEWTNDATSDLAVKTLTLVDEQYADSIAAQQTYALPDFTISPTIVFYDGTRLLRENISDWWQATDINATGTPQFFSATSDALYLRPIPDTTATMRYFRTYRPTPFASITDAVDMPFGGRYNALIRAYVKARAMEQAGDLNEAQVYQNRYDAGVQEAAHEARKERGADSSNLPSEAY